MYSVHFTVYRPFSVENSETGRFFNENKSGSKMTVINLMFQIPYYTLL